MDGGNDEPSAKYATTTLISFIKDYNSLFKKKKNINIHHFLNSCAAI